MSTLMEDRLTAALRARAEQVQPEHLRRVEPPVVPLRPRRRRVAVVAGLAVAATAAAVAGPLLLGGPDAGRGPDPAGPSDPTATSTPEAPRSEVTLDLDGDGSPDTARLLRTGAGDFELEVVRAGGETDTLPVAAADPGPLLSAGDLGGGPGEELVMQLVDDASVLPAVYTWLERDGVVLTAADWPDSGLQGWRDDIDLDRWAVDEGRLRTWEVEPVPGDERVPFWDWSVDDRGRLRPSGMALGCVRPGDAPVACEGPDRWGKESPDRGPRGDLPTLMPAIADQLSHERYHYGLGSAADDYAQLQGDLGEEGGAVADGQVELVVTAMGVEHRVPITEGQSPRLVPQVLVVAGDAPVFVVQRSGGDTAVIELFTFWNGELIQVEPTGDVFLGSGVVDYEGELTEQRTWLTPDGRMFTAVLLDWETRRHHLWTWNDGLDAETIAPTDLGEACIDWETGKYGRC